MDEGLVRGSIEGTARVLKSKYATETDLIAEALWQAGITGITGEGEEFVDNLKTWFNSYESIDKMTENLDKFWDALKKYQPSKTNTR
ncbi:MAG: hypothetical protein J6T34_05280 [Bacilli bacterium]|nr:hypothetical protein [Bacilli bacterium]